MPKIFISYRRDDSADAAGRLHDRLTTEFGKSSVFIDVDNIPFGVDFRKHLGNAVGSCDVLLAIMGDEWLDARDREGKRRLDDESDFVRIEIATALQRQIPVIPILVGTNTVPKRDQLPLDLQELAFRNAAEIRAGAHFSAQVDRLVKSIRSFEPKVKPATAKPVLVAKRAPESDRKPQPESKSVSERAPQSPPKESTRPKTESIPLWQQAFLLYAPKTTASLILRIFFFPALGLAALMALGTLLLGDAEHKYDPIVKVIVITFYFGCVYLPFWLPARILDLMATRLQEQA